MAEICSAYPSAGSVYHWSSQVTSKEWAPLLSYITGWANFLGNAAGDASFATGFASFLSAALAATGDEPLDASSQVGMSIYILIITSALNFFKVDKIGWVNNLAAIAHTVAIVVIVIAILSKSSQLSSGEFVFTQFYNDTGFESRSYVGAIGITSALFAFVGYEVRLAE